MKILTNTELVVILILAIIITGMLYAAFKDDKEFF